MIDTFAGTNCIEVYLQAQSLVGYEFIKGQLLQALFANPDFTHEQKLAIKVASIDIQAPSHSHDDVDKMLLHILHMTWEDAGATGTVALLPEQRAGIIDGLMTICKTIIDGESQRLSQIALLETNPVYDYADPYHEAP